MKTSKIAWGVATVIIILGTVWYLSKSGSSDLAPAEQNTVTDNSQKPPLPAPEVAVPQTNTASTPTSEAVPMTATVIYGPNGFSPSTVNIAKGGTVTFKNQGGDEMWVASNPHPTHEGYSGTTKKQHCPDSAGVAFDQCSSGAVYSFNFQKVGTWSYHNHGNAGDRGTVIVQ